MRCPGQDPRYWKEDAVFEVPCPECGSAVEFFKDESSGRCSRCGHRFPNPGIDFGCAKWCSLAEQCLGFVPERELVSGAQGGALAGRLIQEVKEAFQADPARIARSLRVFHYAKELASKEGGDPRVVLAAALLLDVAPPPDSQPPAPPGDLSTPDRARQILRQIGLDEETVGRVGGILDALRTGVEGDSAEARIVRDADALAGLARDAVGLDPQTLEDLLRNRLQTEAARQRARALFQ